MTTNFCFSFKRNLNYKFKVLAWGEGAEFERYFVGARRSLEFSPPQAPINNDRVPFVINLWYYRWHITLTAYLTPILQSITQGLSKSCKRSCISIYSLIVKGWTVIWSVACMHYKRVVINTFLNPFFRSRSRGWVDRGWNTPLPISMKVLFLFWI